MTSTAQPENLLPAVTELARRAGEAILRVYADFRPEVTYKDDESPLTRADLDSHRVLAAGLRALAPEIPLLSEEGAHRPYRERRGWRRFWLVDPLDGTKEFISRNGEFTVNVALIVNGVPVLGVVYAPTLERTYAGTAEGGATVREGAGEPRPIRATGTGDDTLTVVASRSHPGPDLDAFLAALPPHRMRSMGSSLKICLVAAGDADLYPRLGPTMEWDTAAAHGVVHAAGGRVLDFSGDPLRYNKEDLHNPRFIVLGERPVPWRDAYRAATG